MKREHRPTGAAVANSVPTAPTTAAPIELLTVAEVAARLKIPVSSVYEKTRWRRANNAAPPLPCRRVGKYIRVIASELDAWLLALPQAAHATKRRYTQRKQAA
jgi:hypothetical protein